MGENERIKRLVAYYTKLYQTSNPFELADRIGVLYQIGNCKHEGHYMFLKNHRYIFLSNTLEGNELNLVMAHELGHALLDRKTNCYFIRNKTLFLSSKIEKRANLFAAHLLITDDMLQDYKGHTREQFCNCTGYPEQLIDLRLKSK
jgi:Zn-dependent peptidase ImmA (M78 family)